ncbi:MAG: hypothetical protein PHT33_04750 [bacterium]|nr:hypothetical protein [bacterium]
MRKYGVYIFLLALSIFCLSLSPASAQQGFEIKGGYVSTDNGTGWVAGAGLIVSRTNTTETIFALERYITSSTEDVFGIDRETEVSAWPLTLTNKVFYPGSRFYYGTGLGVYRSTTDILEDGIEVSSVSRTNIGYHLLAGFELGAGTRLEGKYFQGGSAAGDGFTVTLNKVF